MSTLSLRLPDSLHRHIKEFSKREGVSINQLIAAAVAEKMSALSTEEYLKERAARGGSDQLKQILKEVPSVEPFPEDKIDS